MSKFEFKLPDIGEGVTEGEIVNWLVDVGDSVGEDQDLVEVMTDKATVTIGAPKAGTISELRGNPGDVVPVGGVLVVFDIGGESTASEDSPPEASPVAPPAADPAPALAQESDADDAPVAVGDLKESLPGTTASSGEVPREDAEAASGPGTYFNAKPLAAPATRKLARELGVDIRTVEPGGKGGRVTREDVERSAVTKPASTEAVQQATTVRPVPETTPTAFTSPTADRSDQRIPIRGVRRRIYENMARSKRTAAHFTYVDECEVSRLRAFRARSKAIADRENLKLTFLPFIIKAVVAALKKHPQLNSLVDDEHQEIIQRASYDIGIAAATEAGLIVPVLRNADRLSILEIAAELMRLGDAARDGKIRPEDLGGSSFTITSLGKLGGLMATPVVNYPEVAILGVHEMKRRPVVKDDQIVIGEVMLLSLSFDHRVIDGHVGAAFAQEIILYLEEPERLILGMS
jgi:pyruvate dehydrogenase E2 component (dihydrolipoamide acetyltransferase)